MACEDELLCHMHAKVLKSTTHCIKINFSYTHQIHAMWCLEQDVAHPVEKDSNSLLRWCMQTPG